MVKTIHWNLAEIQNAYILFLLEYKQRHLHKKSLLDLDYTIKDFFFIGQVLDLPNTGNHTQHITCTIRLEIALS